MALLLFFPISFLLAIPAIILSIINVRQPSKQMLILSVVFIAFLLLFYLINWKYIWYVISNPDNFAFAIVIVAMPAIPVYFVIASLNKRKASESEVTDDYLDSIINEDEDELN